MSEITRTKKRIPRRNKEILINLPKEKIFILRNGTETLVLSHEKSI